uniref:Uncharacterized protein n=1 Tax=Acrobeloides nanus TaxID=290746 RepID=A0A914DNX7_9BILA
MLVIASINEYAAYWDYPVDWKTACRVGGCVFPTLMLVYAPTKLIFAFFNVTIGTMTTAVPYLKTDGTPFQSTGLILDSYRQACDTYKEALDGLRNQIKDLENENIVLNEHNNISNEEVEKYRQELGITKIQYEEMKNRFEVTTKALTAKNEEAEQLQIKIADLTINIKELDKKLENETSIRKHLEIVTKDQEAKLKANAEEIAQLKADNAKKDQEIDKLQKWKAKMMLVIGDE